MDSTSLVPAQHYPHYRTVLKCIRNNFWVSTTMSKSSPVILQKERKCHFCKQKENNKLKYGPLYELNRVVAHYYCVLLSTQMKQNGKDNEGIMGFLLDDINSELRRSKKVVCAYCPEMNATVECAHAGCKKIFHFPCGLKSGALSRFRNDFITFCHVHRPKQRIPRKILNEFANTEVICAICYEKVETNDRVDSLWAPCCAKTWYHRNCVEKLAQSSGYFFRCATCNDTEKFKAHMENNGIFVPQQDASWELVPNAYEELLVRHSSCDAVECRCPNGRDENVEDTRWEVILCRFCGSQGIHVGCGDLKFSDPQWECNTCQSIMKTDKKSDKKTDKKTDKKSDKKVENEADKVQPDVTVKKTPPKCDEPAPSAARKRKLSEEMDTAEKRKKDDEDEEDDFDDDEDDDEDDGGPSNSDPKKKKNENEEEKDEFYIKLPEFLFTDKNRPKSGEEGIEEEIDVISIGSAWLMVEEVLSRVKPSPLSYKLKFLRKRRFVCHFDPFDIREEEKIETIDLASDSDDERTPLLRGQSDSDSDVQIIEEIVRSESAAQVKPEPQIMDKDNRHEKHQPREMSGAVAPEAMETDSNGPVDNSEEFDIYVVDDLGEARNVPDAQHPPAPSQIQDSRSTSCDPFFHYLSFTPEVVTASTSEREFLSSLQSMNPEQLTIDTSDEDDRMNVDFDYGPKDLDGPREHLETMEEDSSEDADDQNNTQRKLGQKHSASRPKNRGKAKRRRTATEQPTGSSIEQPTAGCSMEQPTAGCSIEQPTAGCSFEHPITSANIEQPIPMESTQSPSIIDSNTSAFGFTINETGHSSHTSGFDSNGSTYDPNFSAPMASWQPSGEESTGADYPMAESSDNSNLVRDASVPNFAILDTATLPSVIIGNQAFIMFSGSDSTIQSLYGPEQLPVVPSMPTMPSTSAMTSTAAATSMTETTTSSTMMVCEPSTSGMPVQRPSSLRSGAATPLPSFQFFASLQPGLSPISKASSSSDSTPGSVRQEGSFSGDSNNDVFVPENGSKKSDP